MIKTQININKNQKSKETSFGLLPLSLKKVEMEVMFGDFEDRGWWLVVLGCWGELEVARTENTGNSWAGVVRERMREKLGFAFGCIFLTNLTNLAKILSSKMTFSQPWLSLILVIS